MGAVLPRAPTPSTSLTLRPPSQFWGVFSRMTRLLRVAGKGGLRARGCWLLFLPDRDMGDVGGACLQLSHLPALPPHSAALRAHLEHPGGGDTAAAAGRALGDAHMQAGGGVGGGWRVQVRPVSCVAFLLSCVDVVSLDCRLRLAA